MDEQTTLHVIEALRAKKWEIAIGDLAASSVSPLGGGGSKSVYDIALSNQHYALALPNVLDNVATVMQKWQHVLREPENTIKLREIGLRTNSLSELVRIKLNGIAFPGLLMRRYSDLPFEVRDNKNATSSIGTSRIISSGASVEAVANIIKPLAEDIQNLLNHNIRVGRDSLNLCVDGGKPYLYFNDLGTVRFEPIPADKKAEFASFYADAAIGAVINGITQNEYREYGTMLDEQRNALRDGLLREVAKKTL